MEEDSRRDNSGRTAASGQASDEAGEKQSYRRDFPGNDPGAAPWDMYRSPAVPLPRKRKWLVALLSLFIPGTGHFYLGLMQKGLMIMLLIIMDIFAIVHFSINMSSIPLITLLALFLPIIYFYSLFDALLSTDKVNAYAYGPEAAPYEGNRDIFGATAKPGAAPYLGWLLVGAGALFFALSAKPDWVGDLMDQMGTVIGGFALIAIGVVVFLKNSSKPK
ncbi:hypothetical protein ACFFNY_18770 [Paenibacillus hodogayensis]|uniref:TM2 domain-containing protein n=1 Tax=Paenibacillus hodogayensis TaxID=279208 RepID=A0ABV5VZ91_9BACL